MTSLSTLVLAAVLQAASPAPASGPAHAAAGTAPPASSAAFSAPQGLDMDRVVCRRLAETGSRLGGATQCATKAQWRQRELDTAEYIRGAQSKGIQQH